MASLVSVEGTYLPAQPPMEASPAKQSASTLIKPLTNGIHSMATNSQESPDHNNHRPAERRHQYGISWYHLPVSLSAEEPYLVKEFQTHVMPLVRPRWTRKHLRHRVFEDGVTNKLVGFFHDDPEEAPSSAADKTAVLLRVNGEGRELFVDGHTEIQVILTLHEAGLCPPLYLVAENALCYGYIPGRALTSSEMQANNILY